MNTVMLLPIPHPLLPCSRQLPSSAEPLLTRNNPTSHKFRSHHISYYAVGLFVPRCPTPFQYASAEVPYKYGMVLPESTAPSTAPGCVLAFDAGQAPISCPELLELAAALARRRLLRRSDSANRERRTIVNRRVMSTTQSRTVPRPLLPTNQLNRGPGASSVL